MERWVVRPFSTQNTIRRLSRIVTRKTLVNTGRPLVLAAGFLAAGQLMVHLVPLTLSLLICLAVCTVTRFKMTFKPAWLSIGLPLIMLGSMLWTAQSVLPPKVQADQLDGQYGWITGCLDDVVYRSNSPSRAVLVTDKKARIMICFGPEVPRLYFGDTIEVLIRPVRPLPPTNPGGFDERAWLSSMGIDLKAFAESSGVRLIREGARFNPKRLGQQWRDALFKRISQCLDAKQADFLTALLVGEKARLDTSVKQQFKQAGLSHLMSVSGANVAWMLHMASRFIRQVRLSRKKRIVVVFLLLLTFATLTGWQVSVTRAVLMSGFVWLGKLLQRPSDPLTSLSAAVLLILMASPYAVLSLGFWLSACATLSLILFTRQLASRLSELLWFLPDWIIEPFAATLCIQMGLVPLLVAISREVSLVALIANPPAAQLAMLINLISCCLVPFAMLAGLLVHPFVNDLLLILFKPVGVLLDLLLGLAMLASNIRIGRISGVYINLSFWLVWIMLGISFIPKRRLQPVWFKWMIRKTRSLRWGALSGWLIVVLILITNQPLYDVWVFDVGQGDAILIRSKDGQTLLVDGGEAYNAQSVLIPAMTSLSIDKIDLAVVTHGHQDHAGGILELIAAGRIRELAVSQAAASDSAFVSAGDDLTSQLLDAAQLNGIRVSEIKGNDTMTLGNQGKITWINSPTINVPGAAADINDYSLIMQADLAGTRLIMTGDCTASVEQFLLAEDAWPQADVLKVAHHGSAFASSTAFLKQVQPAVALISVGPNRFGHPSPATMNRLSEAGCQIYRTDMNGAIHLEIYQDRFCLGTFLKNTISSE